MATSADELFLKQALELAARGQGLASPNPLVADLTSAAESSCSAAVIADIRASIDQLPVTFSEAARPVPA